MSYIIQKNSEDTLRKEVVNNLSAIAVNNADRIETYINEKRNDITVLSYSPGVIDAMDQFAKAFKNGGIDSSQYQAVDQQFRPFLTNHIEIFEECDLLLISSEGDAVFSVKQGGELGTNFITGLYKNTELALVVDRAKTLMSTELSDSNFYQGTNRPALFLATPVLKEKNIIGVLALHLDVLALHLDVQSIYRLVQNHIGSGKTGETIIGKKIDDQFVLITRLDITPLGR